MKKLILPLAALAATAVTTQAAVTLVHEYHLGEAGSLGTNNLPNDSAGSSNFTNAISGGSATIGLSGAVAPGSTAYLDTSSATNTGWFGADFSGLATDNFAIGVYARAASLGSTQGDVFTTGGTAGAFKISLANNGWAASADGVAWIGGTQGVSGSFTANTWAHIAIIRKNGSSQLYINGVAQGSAYAGGPTHGQSHLSVAPGGTSYFDGHIDEARVVTFAVSDSDTDILNSLQAVPEPSSTALLGLGGLALILRRRK